MVICLARYLWLAAAQSKAPLAAALKPYSSCRVLLLGAAVAASGAGDLHNAGLHWAAAATVVCAGVFVAGASAWSRSRPDSTDRG